MMELDLSDATLSLVGSEVMAARRPVDPRTIRGEARFRVRLAELGHTLIGVYVDSQTPVLMRCKNGHECQPWPNSVMQGQGVCPTCAGNDSDGSEKRFKTRLTELGAIQLGSYVNNYTPVLVRCTAGHECRPRPNSVQRGQGVCQICARCDPAEAFKTRLTELGATQLGAYVNTHTPVLVRCAAGHESRTRPSYVQQGRDVCSVCGGRDSDGAEKRFKTRLTELGATQLGSYVNDYTPVLVRCAAGHECRPRAYDAVRLGRGICLACSGHDSAVALIAFKARLAELGHTFVGPYQGTGRPCKVLCSGGHEWYPRPSHIMHRGLRCSVCTGKDPAVAKAVFEAKLVAQGCILIGEYTTMNMPVLIRCSEGHVCKPRPASVMSGNGACRFCAHREWNVFYIVSNPDMHLVKFGVSSGDSKSRLDVHKRKGFITVHSDIYLDDAHDLEQHILTTLKDAGEHPVRGYEYFDISCLGIISDQAENWPVAP